MRSERYVSAALQSLLAVLIGVQLAAAQAAPANTSAPVTAESLKAATRSLQAGGLQNFIAPDDVLEIKVLDVAELSGEYRVSPDGSIVMPLLAKHVVAAGLTSEELAAVVADRLRSAGLVSTPHVLVTVKSSMAHAVAIMGAVMKPQIYPVFGPTTLLDVLAQAEGLAPDAGDTAMITRGDVAARESGPASDETDAELLALAEPTLKVDLNKLLKTGEPSLNLTIYPGDKVTVERAPIVYVVGAVNRAGGFPMTGDQRDMTVLKALALAQSLSPTAQRKRAFLIRENPDAPSQRQQIPLNLSKILTGKAPDPKLVANDVLFVPDSTAKRALNPAIQVALQTISGMAIWGRF